MNDLNGNGNPVGNQLCPPSDDELEKLLTSLDEILGDRLAIKVIEKLFSSVGEILGDRFAMQAIEVLLSSVGEILGDRLAIQVKLVDGKMLTNRQFKKDFPWIVEQGNIEQEWSNLSPQEKHISAYGETGYYEFVSFDPNKFDAIQSEYIIHIKTDSEKLERNKGKLYYYGKYEFPSFVVICLFRATEDISRKRERRRNEIAARAVLDSVLRTKDPESCPTVNIWSQPCESEIGGDFYVARYFLYNGQLKRQVLFVGDCSGHGMSGGLLSVLAGSILIRYLNQGVETVFSHKNPAEALIEFLSNEMRAARPGVPFEEPNAANGQRFSPGIDGCAIVVDYTKGASGRRVYYACGNSFLWQITKACDGQAIDGTKIEELGNADPSTIRNFKSIGVTPDITSKHADSFPLTESVRLVTVTDGVLNQRSIQPTTPQFGLAQMEDLLKKTAKISSQDALNVIQEAWITHRGTAEQEDDALVAIFDIELLSND